MLSAAYPGGLFADDYSRWLWASIEQFYISGGRL